MMKKKEIEELMTELEEVISKTSEESTNGKLLRRLHEYIEQLEQTLEVAESQAEEYYQRGRTVGMEDMARLILVEHEQAKERSECL